MSIEPTQAKTIDGCDIQVTPMGSVDAAVMLAKLMRYAGPVMPAIRRVDFASLGKNTLLDFTAFVEPISALMAAMPPEEFRSILVTLLSRCTVIAGDGDARRKFDLSSTGAIDKAFSGKLALMVKTLAHVLEVNYAGFFQDLVFGDNGAAHGA